MAGDAPTVASGARLEAALKLLQGKTTPAVGVLDRDGRLAGYVTSENIGELLMVRQAGIGLNRQRATGPLLPR